MKRLIFSVGVAALLAAAPATTFAATHHKHHHRASVAYHHTKASASHATHRAVGTTGRVAHKTSVKSKHAANKSGNAISDGWITTKVKSSFVGKDALKGSDINVDTNNHVVTLKGTVPSEAGRARAIAIAKETKGVDKVVDELTIAPKK
jgi:osmotically-inducible protein OsmY